VLGSVWRLARELDQAELIGRWTLIGELEAEAGATTDSPKRYIDLRTL